MVDQLKDPMSDEAEIEIIERILAGDSDSFRLLVDRYQHLILNVAYNITRDAHLSEDVAQHVFFTAYKKLNYFDPARAKFSTWICTIARNRAINVIRHREERPDNDTHEPRDKSDAIENIDRKEMLKDLDRALVSIPASQRRAFRMVEFDGLTYEEVAQIECAFIGTIKSRVNRAKKKLRLALEKYQGDTV